MDNEEIIRALEEELTDIERRVSRDEKEVDIIESKEKRKADLKQKIKQGKKDIFTLKKKKLKTPLNKIYNKKKKEKEERIRVAMKKRPVPGKKVPFTIEYTTNFTGDKKFKLKQSKRARWIKNISVGNDKETDNIIRKLINNLLEKGTTFIPPQIYNKSTKRFEKPNRSQQYKIRDFIINVQSGNKLFKKVHLKNKIIISVKLFLQETRGPGGKDIPFSMKKVKSNVDLSCDYHLNALKNIGKRIIGGSRNAKGGGFTGVWIVRKNKPSIRKFIKDHLTPELVHNTQLGDHLLEDLKLVIDNNDVDDDEYIYIERHEEMVSIEGKPLEYVFSWNCCPDREEAGMMCEELEDEEWQQCKWIEINESRPNLNTSSQHGGRKKTRKKRKKRNRKTRRK